MTVEICGVSAEFVKEGGFNGSGEYFVSEEGFRILAEPFFDKPNDDKNDLRPGIVIGKDEYIGVLSYNGVPVNIKEH